MSATTPDPIQDTITTLRDRASDLRNYTGGSKAGAVIGGLIGAVLMAWTWNDLGSAAPFSSGVVLIHGAFVMVVCIGALTGHRVTNMALLRVVEWVAHHDAHTAELQRSGAERARQIDALTGQVDTLTGQIDTLVSQNIALGEKVAVLADQNNTLSERASELTEQLAGLRSLIGGRTESLDARRNNR